MKLYVMIAAWLSSQNTKLITQNTVYKPNWKYCFLDFWKISEINDILDKTMSTTHFNDPSAVSDFTADKFMNGHILSSHYAWSWMHGITHTFTHSFTLEFHHYVYSVLKWQHLRLDGSSAAFFSAASFSAFSFSFFLLLSSWAVIGWKY